MQWWGGLGHAGVRWVKMGWDVSCRGGWGIVGHGKVGWCDLIKRRYWGGSLSVDMWPYGCFFENSFLIMQLIC